MLTQRLGSDTQKDPRFLDDFIKIVKENPGSCDEVWLATDYGFPSLEAHAETAKILEGVAEKLRGVGRRVSLQISNTIGHGEYMSSRDCSGLVYEGSHVEKMVGHDGSVANYCFCPNGKHFRDYTFSYIREYVKRIKPYCVWVDDDLRAHNHAPVEYGCFCDACMAKFNQTYGSGFTREELVREINFGDKSWREKHIEFTRNTLYDFTYEMGRVIHEASPESRMGYQHALNRFVAGPDSNFIFDAMYKSTGHAPASRPGGGSYDDHDMRGFIFKGDILDMDNRTLPDYVKDRRPEIENLPDIVFGKSIAGTCFETSYYLASGNNAMSYAMLMSDYEPMEWHGKMLSAFASHRQYWERLACGSEKTEQGGMVYAVSNNAHLKDASEVMGYARQTFGAVSELRYIGISIAIKKAALDDELRLLHYKNAREMTLDELDELLRHPVITDAETVIMLNERGFELPLDAAKIDTGRLCERFSEHVVNKGFEARRWNGQFLGKGGYEIIAKDGSKVEPLSEYVRIAPAATPKEKCIYMANAGVCRYVSVGKTANAVFTTKYGAKWAVFGFDIWNRNISCEKRNAYLNTAAYISGHRQPAEVVTPIQALLQSRVDKDGRLTQVSVTNITVADSGEVVVRVNDPASGKAVFMGQYTDMAELEMKKTETDGIFEIKIPNLKPWAVSTIFFK